MALPVMTIEGDVIAAHSYWTDDHAAIVTEATVHTADGDVVVSQLGGSVDGIGMRQFPSPPILETGMKVSVAAHHSMDALQRDHVVVDDAQVMSSPLSAHYVRTGPTKAGHYLYWEANCIEITVDAAGTKAIPSDQAMPVIQASVQTWNDDTASCSYMTAMIVGTKALEVGNDKVNLIKFRDDHWGRPAVGSQPARDYPAAAAGLTTAVYIDDASSDRDGAILDADIELNNVNFDITIEPDPNDPGNAVLQNTLTHEVGHLHGLEHPCLAPGDPARVDNTGAPVPDCSSALPAKITEATMYNYQNPGETKKETLSDDDIQSMCDIYPKDKDPGYCAAPGSGGGGGGGCCSASGERADVSVLLGGLTFGLLVAGRRRKKLSRAE